MSDKSFGDHINRGIVKNQLLSTAVTGVSFEDLTHKAVLLPATPTQGQATQLDEQQGSQTRTLAHADYDKPTFPSGDAYPNISIPNTPSNILPNVLDSQYNEKKQGVASGTPSKASVKSEDDFDVNEYIARLQGTRYVSAPLHSHLKEDQNTNLETEESLEEINLNESAQEQPVEVQQSLTADIAQNFSQLPTVLPHVASAVFSSFSNMLSMKSREQTPDDAKPTGYQDAQFEKSDVGVPLMGVDESTPKDFGLPPKEPPISGAGNYRISTKKKYAPIPGLSYGDASQNMYHNINIPPVMPVVPGTNYIPPILTPEETLARSKQVAYIHGDDGGVTHGFTPLSQNNPPFFTPADSHNDEFKTVEATVSKAKDTTNTHAVSDKHAYLLNPVPINADLFGGMPASSYNAGVDNKNSASTYTMMEDTVTAVQLPENRNINIDGQPNFFTPIDHKYITTPRLPIIPPPPMFSNLPRKDSQTSVGKGILPPSVARRISANQPLIKTQPVPAPTFSENIFVPTAIPEMSDQSIQPRMPPTLPPSITSDQKPPSIQPPQFMPPKNLPSSAGAPFFVPSPAEKPHPCVIGAPFFTPSPAENPQPSAIGAPFFTPSPAENSQPSAIGVPFFTPSPAENPQPSAIGTPFFTPSSADNPQPSTIGAPFFTPSSAENPQPSTIGAPFFTPSSAEKPQPSMIGAQFFTPSNTEVSQAFGIGGPNIPPPTGAAYLTSIPPSSTPFGVVGSLPPSNIASDAYLASMPAISNVIPTIPAEGSSNIAPQIRMFTPTIQNKPPPTFFNPLPVTHDMPHPITQMPPGLTPEPTKPLVEPPKATGAVNFRMTKKRPQYYSGPIEGVGDISSNVKPTIAPGIPSVPSVGASAYQSSLFTPEHQFQTVEQYTSPNVQSSIPFDISKPAEPAALYATFEAKQQQSFTPFDISQPQQTYGQEYSTAFDLSRQTTEAFDPPKQEAKGFGIIGSLKSKLSSIDINKIQSTVTTFFDPDYNEAKVDPALETAPYAPSQYAQHSQEQSNFEIMVPSVDQNQYSQFGFQHGYQYDQNKQHYPAENAYNYAQNERQNPASYFAEPNYTSQQVYTDPALNINTHEYSSASPNDTQENIPQNVENISSHNLEHENKDTQGVVTFYNPATIQEHTHLKTEIATNYSQQSFEKSNVPSTSTSPFVSANVGIHGAIGDFVPKIQPDIAQSKIHFIAPLPPAISFFDGPISGDQESKYKTDELIDEMEKLAMAEEIAIANSPFQAVDLQIGSAAGSKVIEISGALSKAVGQNIITATSHDKSVPKFPINKEYELGNDQQGSSLIESLSKDTIPVVAVSSVPLFGLSAIIADKTQEISNLERDFKNTSLFDSSKEITIPNLEKQSSFSFFENIAVENKLHEEPHKAAVGMSISDVKNVLLIEPPQENLGTILKRNASSSLLKDLPEAENKSVENLSQERGSSWHFDKAMVTSKDNVNVLFDKKASGFFNHLMQSENPIGGIVEKEDTEVSEQTSDFNICETCREVNVHEDKENENVTKQLIENINSSIQLSNPVEALLSESYPESTAEERAFEEEQFDDINQITEETIETLQGQSISDRLDAVATSSNDSYEWTAEQLAYASIAAIDQDFGIVTGSDPSNFGFQTDDTNNTAVDPEYTFKIDPNAIGFFGDNSLFFDNVPNNASDEIKAEFKTHEDIVLPRQMSIPSAPPADDDSKSDETGGLDVHSIEQDATKDFPIEEEFIIEPSETDDDKIEFREQKRSSEDLTLETFTDRIEKFKNNAVTDFSSNDYLLYQKSAEHAVPPKSMASYFDTGNFAAETHYRKSLTSPTNIKAFQEQGTTKEKELTTIDPYDGRFLPAEVFRLPPGFEDELRRQYNEQYPISFENNEPLIPDTTTQTQTTTILTSATAHEDYTIAGCKSDNVTIMQQGEIKHSNKPQTMEKCEEEKRQYNEQEHSSCENKEPFIPETTTQTRTTTTLTSATAHENYTIAGFKADNVTIMQRGEIKHSDTTPTMGQCEEEKIVAYTPNKDGNEPKTVDDKIPAIARAFSSTNLLIKDHTQTLGANNEPKYPTVNAEHEIIKQDAQLPDPRIFFSSNTEEPNLALTEPASFNRLASYFSIPPAQPDHSKSFFELSQSQNHYRHVTNSELNRTEPKPDQNPSQGHVLDSNTQANLVNIMHDLTSTRNIMNRGDEIVRTVNYFSVEHDNLEIGIPKLEKLKLPSNNSCITNLDGTDLDSANGQNKTQDKVNLDSSINDKKTDGRKINNEPVYDDINIINTCEFCSNINLLDRKDYKVKNAADSDARKEKDGNNMNEKSIDSSNQKNTVSVDFGNCKMGEEANDDVTVLDESGTTSEYTPVRHHWFYRFDVEDKSVWRGFSTTDSNALEHAFRSPELTDITLVPTDGGRFDVNIVGRLRLAVYWKQNPTNVRRCSWFYKGTTDARYVPYTEAVADKLEEEYRHGMTTGEWHRRLVLPNSELVVMHGPAVMVHFLHGGPADSFSSPPFLLGKRVYRNPPKMRMPRDLRPAIDHLIMVVHGAGEYKQRASLEDPSSSRPRVVRRGCEESEIEDPEPSSIDHLLLLCHGVGSACDMRFRSVEEVVEDFRSSSLQLLQSHYKNSYDNGIVSRVEVLPISWHEQLHVGEGGVDRRLSKVTLESIPRLRAFTNHTVLDALFYTSPVYHQTIIDTVCSELNRVYSLFKQRNPHFKGGVSLGGHSLGSVILYDLLCHQSPQTQQERDRSSRKSYLPGSAQPLDKYPQLQFPPAALYALGSPIAIFECIRGVEALGLEFSLPTCKNFFNIFHPYDPIAYRIEPLINPLLQDAKPFLIPHHKGRKRMHLELKDTMARVGADLKQKLIESLRTTWNKWKASPPLEGQLEKVVEEEMEKEQLCEEATPEQIDAELTTSAMLGKLNDGRRVDYVLQEAPLEMINEYLFAMSSHVGYWESEDTMLLMLREIYSSLGVQPDCTVPQHTLTVTRATKDHVTILNEKELASTSRGSS